MAACSFDITLAIIASRNGPKMHPCIRSAIAAVERAGSYGIRTEILLVLENPDDETIEFCNEFLPSNVRVENLVGSHLGKSSACNHAVSLSQSEFVTLTYASDLILPNWLLECHKFMLQDCRELILHPSYVLTFEKGLALRRLIDQEDKHFSKYLLFESNPWSSLSFSKRTVYQKVPFREVEQDAGFGHEDWLFYCDSIASGVIHKVVPGTIHCVRDDRDRAEQPESSNLVLPATPLFALPWSRQV